MNELYSKPVVLLNEELAEGIYAASGCFTVTASIHQRPQVGRGDYRLQVNATHAAEDGHHSKTQYLIMTFNQPVEYSYCNGNGATYVDGNGTNTITIMLTYHQNGGDNIGIGDFVVVSDQGLQDPTCVLTCDHQCEQGHSW